ncbi:MAG: glycoside hydrolase family 16 protein [Pirellulales bacterium]
MHIREDQKFMNLSQHYRETNCLIHRLVQDSFVRGVVVLVLVCSSVNGLSEEVDSKLSDRSKLPACVTTDYELVWRDEFEGKSLDPDSWTMPSYKTRDAALLNSEGTIRVADGVLNMRTLWRNEKVHATYIQTRGRHNWKHGYFECRLKFQKYQGHHGAFWVQTPHFQSFVDEPGKSGTEMDIIEWFGAGRRRGWAGMNIYYWGTTNDGMAEKVRSPSIPDFPKMGGPVEGRPESPMGDLSEDFHVYGLLWTDKECVFFCDGVEIMRDTKAISQVPQYVVLSLLCSHWERPRLDVTKLPDEMQIDYVRVYQKQ